MKNKRVKMIAGIVMLSLVMSACGGAGAKKEADESKTEIESTVEPEVTEEADQEEMEPEVTKEAEETDAEQEESDAVSQENGSDTESQPQKVTAEESAGTDNSAESSAPSAQSEKASTDSSSNKAQVQVYAGVYFDSAVYAAYSDEDSGLDSYCEINVSNVTDSSFDFSVSQVEIEENQDGTASENKSTIFKNHTAKFTAGGTQAVYNGNEYTLTFTFPDNHSAYPVATDMVVSGFSPLEGHTYVNNSIPGHEFG
ncbi:MAG: hypothetical protein EOM40_06505 [Clostridia bacterium]|nr:hypothetical protein [Clostridia bacterium]NCC44050.1 hypothetical protein [Clostridia bacterium]